MNKDKVNQLNQIAKARINMLRQIELLDELAETIKAEGCIYHIAPLTNNRFGIVEAVSGVIILSSTPDKLKSWLRLRGLSENEVYRYELLLSNE